MKILKKLFCAAIALGMMCAPVTAEQSAPVIIGVDEMVADKAGWTDSENAIKFENNSVIREPNGKNTIYTYTAKKYQNELLEFNINFGEFSEYDWATIMLRTCETDQAYMWNMKQHYAFLMRPDYVEVQKRNGGAIVIGLWPHDIKPNETATIQCGAVNFKNGVQLILKINGKVIVNYFDNDNVITVPGWFALTNSSTVTLSPSENKEFSFGNAIAAGLHLTDYEAGSTKLTASYEKMGGDDEMTLRWYEGDSSAWELISKKHPDQYDFKALLKEIPGMENKTEYNLTDADVGKYIFTGVETKDGYMTLSDEVYIDPYTYKTSKGTFIVNEYEKAYSNGKYKLIDKTNDMFTPETFDDVIYVPVRFINEETGGKTEWNDAERSASFINGNKSSKVYADSSTAVVDGKEITLKNSPIISNSRLMLGFDDIKTVFGIKTKMYDNELMSFSRETIELSDEEVNKMASSVIDAVINN